MRCTTCGRPEGEPCCDRCHEVQARLEREPLWSVANVGNGNRIIHASLPPKHPRVGAKRE